MWILEKNDADLPTCSCVNESDTEHEALSNSWENNMPSVE